MDITISGRNVHVTEAMKNYAREKALRLEKYFERIQHVRVTLNIEGERQMAEMVATAIGGATLVAHTTEPDMYAAIDLVVEKLERQIKKHKEKLYFKRERKKGEATEAEAASGEEAEASEDEKKK